MNAPRRHFGLLEVVSFAGFLFALLTSHHLRAQSDCDFYLYEIPPHADLTINGVNARFGVGNVHFFPTSGLHFEAPAGTGNMPIFAANLVIAGEMGGEVRAIAADYSSADVRPGPLDEEGTPPEDCAPYNRVYKGSQRDLLEMEATGRLTADLLDWPWSGGAPVFDGDGIQGNYNIAAGDRPAVEGHEMLWYVVNDVHDGRRETNSLPLGLELQVSPFAVSSEDPVLEYTVLVRYRLTNRGESPLTSAYFGIHSANNVGRVGSDTTLGLAFGYQTDETNGAATVTHRGAVGYIVVQGLPAGDDDLDNDADQSVDEPDERTRMARFVVWNSDGSAWGNPQTKEDYYNYSLGRWRNGEKITYGGSGRGFSDTPVDFMYPGEPGEYWSEENIDDAGSANSPAYEFMWSTGPFSLDVDESKDLVVAILWAQGQDRFDSVRKLKEAVPKLRAYWDDGFEIPLPAAPSAVPELFAPDNRSTGQPTNPRLSWRKQPDYVRHDVQVARDSDFTLLTDSGFTLSSHMDLNVDDTTTYYWRVRGANAGGYGPWSKTWLFSTGSTQQVAPGALELDGPDTFAFVQIEGAEGENDACNPLAESRLGCSEVGGNGVHLSFNGARTWLMYSYGLGPEYSIGRFAPRDYELRFTLKGSYAYQVGTAHGVIHVPFEAWDIGPTGPFGINDRQDDTQLIAGITAGNEGTCRFGFGDNPVSLGGLDWPVTERIHAYYPTAGSTYADWAALVGPLVATDPVRCPSSPETDEAVTLVDTERRPLQNVVFMMDSTAENYRIEGIPMGNVIRFLTTKPTPPILSAPADESAFIHGSLPDGLDLWWQLPPGVTRSRVQVTRMTPVNEVVVDSVVTGFTFKFRNPPIGLYTWRVGYATDTEFWSEPSTFDVFSIASTENELAEIPGVLTLREPYPNPANGLAHFDVGLPETGRVTLTAYDLLGRRVANIADDPMAAGWRTVDWNTAAVSNGVYVVRLQAGGAAVSRKVVVVR